jgi:hypothetical protein
MKRKPRHLYDPKVEFELQGNNQILMFVRFANGGVWIPRWRDVYKIFDKALLVEKLNRKRFGKGRPKTLLVYPTIDILQSHGYLNESMFRFDMSAEVHETGIILGKTIYIVSEDFQKAKERAIRMFEDSMISRARDLPTFANKLMELKKMVITEYVRKRKFKETLKEQYF